FDRCLVDSLDHRSRASADSQACPAYPICVRAASVATAGNWQPFCLFHGEASMQLTGNSLPETARPQSVELLNQHLAAAIDLHGQLKQAHWNVRGTDCIAIHKLLDKISVHVERSSDLMAERAG